MNTRLGVARAKAESSAKKRFIKRFIVNKRFMQISRWDFFSPAEEKRGCIDDRYNNLHELYTIGLIFLPSCNYSFVVGNPPLSLVLFFFLFLLLFGRFMNSRLGRLERGASARNLKEFLINPVGVNPSLPIALISGEGRFGKQNTYVAEGRTHHFPCLSVFRRTYKRRGYVGDDSRLRCNLHEH